MNIKDNAMKKYIQENYVSKKDIQKLQHILNTHYIEYHLCDYEVKKINSIIDIILNSLICNED